jgi:hypothetical protein
MPDEGHLRLTNTADIGIAATTEEEFDRQVAILVSKDYPALAKLSAEEFVRQLEPLRDLLPKAVASDDEAIPFVIVVKDELAATVGAVERFVVRKRAGWTDMQDELAGFRPIEGVDVPASAAYLLTDIDTGRGTLNVRPRDALPLITTAGRTPLTIDEGVALVTQFPELLKVRNCFQALGSRADNLRIPSFWVSKGAPRLGWCWAGNPHTWLGSASAAARYGS